MAGKGSHFGNKDSFIHNQDGWIVKVEDVPYAWQKKIWLLQVDNAGVLHIANIGENGFLEFRVYMEQDPLPSPLLIIPTMAWKPFVDAIAEALPPVEKEVIDAELKATNRHLQDLRRLVFRPEIRAGILPLGEDK